MASRTNRSSSPASLDIEDSYAKSPCNTLHQAAALVLLRLQRADHGLRAGVAARRAKAEG